ncbi:type II toxin-antitoxin system Phd/YefM family antitoxin [Saccharothrix variisporea]|uniref:Antitoxin Phd_YefM of type II toxin-antitoxin system n=1 Tax=Saccharothrix variisporea TaxID=543527 RepID=A0A495XI93_9PSEU|nr:type II toxin-antitoxin system Phd/YefM family antitoxin [Saccharothrix variisporea]RKT71318.1 antitoxin Phd_YefM of type II toxin-antitoxin system [Saccharothrix variisporea]
MFRFEEPLNESEIGMREARMRLPALLSTVESGSHVVHVTRRGRRVSALVSPDVAESIVAVRGARGPVIPGDIAGAIKLVESLMAEDEAHAPSIDTKEPRREALVGACLTLVDVMLTDPLLNGGELEVELDEGGQETKYVADFLVRILYKRPDVRTAALEAMPLVAGSIWAAQVRGSAAEHRLSIPVEVSIGECYAWIMALWELCRLINAVCGDGAAEELMYTIEEYCRTNYAGTPFEVG